MLTQSYDLITMPQLFTIGTHVDGSTHKQVGYAAVSRKGYVLRGPDKGFVEGQLTQMGYKRISSLDNEVTTWKRV